MKLYQNILDSVTRVVSSVAKKRIFPTDTYFQEERTILGGIYLTKVIVILSAGAVTLGIVKIITTILSGM